MRSITGLRLASAIAIAVTGVAACGDDDEGDAAPTTESTTTTTTTLPEWSYGGPTGPDAWGDLSAAYEACSDGRAQSPIDLADASPADRGPLGVDYEAAPAQLVDTGHTLEVELEGGGTLDLEGTSYELVQFHAHGPSEHHLDGAAFPLELHLVHQSEDGALAVVGVLVAEGVPSEPLSHVVDAIPELGDSPVGLAELDATSLLPEDRAFFHYPGSLTTPPCTEGVAWTVLATPITASTEQIDAVTSSLREPNNRPVQPLGDRTLAVDEDG